MIWVTVHVQSYLFHTFSNKKSNTNGFTNPQLAFSVQSNARNTVMYPSNCNHKSHGDITQTAILLIKEMKRIMSVIGLPFYDHL